MLRTVGWLALPRRALSAGSDGGISPPFQFVAAQLLGGWVPTETGLSPASHSRLLWTHEFFRTPASPPAPVSEIRPPPRRARRREIHSLAGGHGRMLGTSRAPGGKGAPALGR